MIAPKSTMALCGVYALDFVGIFVHRVVLLVILAPLVKLDEWNDNRQNVEVL
jgi:hypothetical protein